jgi:hypothetical protein
MRAIGISYDDPRKDIIETDGRDQTYDWQWRRKVPILSSVPRSFLKPKELHHEHQSTKVFADRIWKVRPV